jgi:diguanylate cyclase (GGDEF)-like protein/PAS domain S-box-containing protein/putative nucleotidyltransferase with HDIG domain
MIKKIPDTTPGLRILVIEDEALIAEEIRERLKRLNYQVIGIADTGAQAIEIARQQCPDLVLMDIQLKGKMDGIEAAEIIYRDRNIPVVHLTAHSDQATFQRAKATAVFGYVLKPFQERDLLVAVEMAVYRHRLEQPLRQSQISFATILAGIADGVIACDLAGRIRFMNPVAEALTGYPLSEAQDRLDAEVLQVSSDTIGSPPESPLSRVLRQQSGFTLPATAFLLDRQGATIPIEGTVDPVVDATGQINGAVIAFRDITERRRLEAQVARQVALLHEKSARLEVQQIELENQRAELLTTNEMLSVTNARLKEAVRGLEMLATTDGLTGLKNHRSFQEHLAAECGRSKRYETKLSLILIDVDRFKQFNDTFGHPAGDVALKQVAAILQSCARQTDVVARYGGEEFAVILAETDKEGALQAAQRFRAAINDAVWEHRAVTASFGIATFGPHSETASVLVEGADQALYYSKQAGRNRIAHVADLPDATTSLLPGNVMPPYTDLITELLRVQTDIIYNASDQIRDVMTQAYDATVCSWARLLDMKDKETEGHSERVTKMTLRLVQRVGMNAEEMLYARWGALLHDIGKMGVPDHILHKPGSLTDDEWAIMRNHTEVAYQLLSPISFLRPALDIPYCHHEKWDGTGYPRGLKGDEIPLAARLFAIIDVYDALTSDRPYRSAWTKEKALEHIRSLQGAHFDPRAVKVFLSEFDTDHAEENRQP